MFGIGMTNASLVWLKEFVARHFLVPGQDRLPQNHQAFGVYLCLLRVHRRVRKLVSTGRSWRTLPEYLRITHGLLMISATDSGIVFDKQLVEKHAPGSGFGLVSMRERMRLIGGQFDIDTHPGDGTVATLIMPLAAQASR